MEALTNRTPVRLDRSRQVAPQIFETLRERMLLLELKPNTVLSRSALQLEFGVSQTPVRDALMKLEQEGLVEIYPQHQTVVSRIDVGAARQAHFLRVAIELEAVRRVASERSDDFIHKAKRAIDGQLAAREDYHRFVAADQSFHQLLYEEARVPALWDIMRRQSVHTDRLRMLNLPLPGKAKAVIAEHEAVVAAIGRDDPDAAVAALRQHLSGTLSIIEQIRARHPDFLSGS